MNNQKKQLIRWFRYQHHHTLPAYESHQHFIGVLGMLEYYAEVDFEEMEGDTWKNILKAINSLSPEEIEKLNNKRKQKDY